MLTIKAVNLFYGTGVPPGLKSDYFATKWEWLIIWFLDELLIFIQMQI